MHVQLYMYPRQSKTPYKSNKSKQYPIERMRLLRSYKMNIHAIRAAMALYTHVMFTHVMFIEGHGAANISRTFDAAQMASRACAMRILQRSFHQILGASIVLVDNARIIKRFKEIKGVGRIDKLYKPLTRSLYISLR